MNKNIYGIAIIILFFTFYRNSSSQVINESIVKLFVLSNGYNLENADYNDSTKLLSVNLSLPKRTFTKIRLENLMTSEIYKNIYEEYLDSGYYSIKISLDSFILPEKKKNQVILYIDCFTPGKVEIVFQGITSPF